MILKGPDDGPRFPITLPPGFPGAPVIPPRDEPVTRGSVLVTNAPGGIQIKPVPFELRAGQSLGPVAGWQTLGEAETFLAGVTAGTVGAAAIVRQGDRFVGVDLEGFADVDLDAFDDAHVSFPLTGRGGLFWRNDALAAVVDGDFVERYS